MGNGFAVGTFRDYTLMQQVQLMLRGRQGFAVPDFVSGRS
jgi:hypothetical protein